MASADDGASWVLVGALVGLAIAVLIGVGFYQGSRRLDLATFFRWTGIALVFIAAGLLSHAIHEFIEIGVITIGTQPLFDVSASPAARRRGQDRRAFLRAMFGYTRRPSSPRSSSGWRMSWSCSTLYLRPIKRPPASAPVSAPTPTTSPESGR